MPTRDETPIALRLSADTLAKAERVRAALAKRSAADGQPPPSRHAVLVLALREGLETLLGTGRRRRGGTAPRPRRMDP